MAPNTNFSTLIATTLQNYSNTLMDNVVTNTTLARFLRRAGNIKIESGGRKFIHQILYSKNSSFAARASLDTISIPNTDSVTASEWEIKVLSGSIFLPELDIAMNAGSREKLIDYAKAKRMEAEISMSELLSDQCWTAVASIGSNDMDSIPKIVAHDVTVSSSVGGINQSAETWWRNYTYGTTITVFSASNDGINAIDTALNNSTYGNQGPKLIVTTKAIYTIYMKTLQSQARYTNMDEADGGFKTLMYATLPFVFDDDCPSGDLYGLDTQNLALQVLAQGNFKQSPFKWATNQLAQSALMYLFCNLSTGSRRTNFVVESISG
jgi:hypothetical protein